MKFKRLIWSKQFSKDVKRAHRRHRKLDNLQYVLKTLQTESDLPRKYKPHPLKGEYAEFMECHIEPDWLLIWKPDSESIYLARTGSHADLFG